jgi:hypothetical protein
VIVGEKMPRHYADEIALMKTKEERIAALEKVPDEWKSLVKKNVEIAFAIRKVRS